MTITRRAILNGIFGCIVVFGIGHYILPLNPVFAIVIWMAYFGTIINSLIP
jgi:hypothetical protein